MRTGPTVDNAGEVLWPSPAVISYEAMSCVGAALQHSGLIQPLASLHDAGEVLWPSPAVISYEAVSCVGAALQHVGLIRPPSLLHDAGVLGNEWTVRCSSTLRVMVRRNCFTYVIMISTSFIYINCFNVFPGLQGKILK